MAVWVVAATMETEEEAAMDEWSFPIWDLERRVWRIRCWRESEMSDWFRVSDIGPLVEALGMTAAELRRFAAGPADPPGHLAAAWQRFIGDSLWEGVDRLRGIGLELVGDGQWVSGGDWGHWVPPQDAR